jgi:hypothetical protein
VVSEELCLLLITCPSLAFILCDSEIPCHDKKSTKQEVVWTLLSLLSSQLNVGFSLIGLGGESFEI